jgi:hypothetical protein
MQSKRDGEDQVDDNGHLKGIILVDKNFWLVFYGILRGGELVSD